MDAFIGKHLQGVSRTYAILVPMLPRDLADAVGAAYLLMRIVDTLEDATELGTAERLRLLLLLDNALADDPEAARELAAPIGDTPDERALMEVTPVVVQKVQDLPAAYREPVCACAREMSSGVCRLIARSAQRGQVYPAVADATELREYCYYVAGTVGEMLCSMMAHHLNQPALERLQPLAVELGIGLQLVNILKDALRDAHHGRRYLPAASGGTVSHTEVYRAVLNQARDSLRKGVDFVLELPATARELRWFCGLPIAWGAMTLSRAEQDASQAKIQRGAISASIELFKKLAGNDHELREWLATLLHPQGGAEGLPQPS